MTADRWSTIEALFDGALNRSPAEREVWLAELCLDPDAHRDVQHLLLAAERTGKFLESPAEVFAEDLVADAETDVGRQVGPYRLLDEISRGGMGIVYLAERADGQYEQRVAVKVLRSPFDAANLHRRFLAERQILASLVHPNIARLLDGGVTDEGYPFLVMTYIEGLPIDVHCREHRLPLAARLRLFATACDAVQYAHQKLIVHRDLKPSNIMVDVDGEVKLLDFGIAKLITGVADADVAHATRTGLHLMTPGYASPEQVTGAPISTASDVYQLGLLLYELLSGRRAYDVRTGSLSEIARVVCEEEPAPPSRLPADGDSEVRLRQLRGDLDAIVMTALRKEPERRYASAGVLADDVRRYLAGLPVAAHSDAISYRFRKFARRNRVLVGSAALLALIVSSYAITVTFQQGQTARERDRAAQYAAFLTDLFAGASPFSTEDLGPETTLREFLEQGTRRVHAELGGDPELQISLVRTIADVHASLGNDSTARKMYGEVLPYQRGRYGERSPEYIETFQRFAAATRDAGTADSLHRAHIALARAAERGAGPHTARGLSMYGKYLYDAGRFDESLRVLHESAGMSEQADLDTRIDVPYYLALVYFVLNEAARADSLLHVAYSLTSEAYGKFDPRTAFIMGYLGVVAENRGDLDAAVRWKQASLGILEEKLGPDHPYTNRQLNNMAVLLGRQGRYAEQERVCRQVLAWREERLGTTHKETVHALQNLATSLLRQGRLDEAEPLYHEAKERHRASRAPAHYLHAFPFLSLADIFTQRGDYVRAEEEARSAAEILSATLSESHPLVGVAMSRQGGALAGQGRFAAAEPMLLRAYEILKSAEDYRPYVREAAGRLADLFDARGRPHEAARYRTEASTAGVHDS